MSARCCLPAMTMMLLATAAVATAVGTASQVTPIVKVIEMMKKMKSTAIAEKKAEAVRMSAFNQFCDDTSAEKTKAIEKAAQRIEKLTADIMKADADIQEASERIAELEEDLDRWEKDKKAATFIREKERADYVATHQEYADTVDALERALELLKSKTGKVKQAFVQTQVTRVAESSRVSKEQRSRLLSLLHNMQPSVEEMPSEELFKSNPKPYAYESQSDPIIAMLAELRERFDGEMRDLMKEELQTKHNYEILIQKLTDMAEMANQEVGQRKKFKTQRQEDRAVAAGEKTELEKTKAEDEKYLAELTALHEQKNTDFDSRQQLRQGEIDALTQAIDIISSESVHADRLPGGKEGTSFVQMPITPSERSQSLARVASLLSERATSTGSSVLANLAKHAKEDPFAKVKDMIRDLIVRLKEEAAEEADHKAFCDAELATNKMTRRDKAEAVDQLAAEVEKLTATTVRLTQEIADLQDEISELEAAMKKATEERQEEKAANEATIADANQSQDAVAQALAVLRDFYAKAAEATALVQQTPADDAPETFSGAYKGLQGDSKGVLGMLEVIESDFARLGVETAASEAAAAAAFKKFMAESMQNKAVAEAEVEHNTNRLDTTQQVLKSTQKSLEQTQVELDAALAYYEKLKPSCVDSGITWEERVKRRKEEIQSLKEAYTILSGETSVEETVPSLQEMKAGQIGENVEYGR